MDRLIELARKMEEEQATPEQLAKVIVGSYRQMDRQRDELKNVGGDRRPPTREHPPSIVNKSVASQQRQSADKRKLNRTDHAEPEKRSHITEQQRIPRQATDKLPPSTTEQPTKKVVLSFRDEDKQFQLFSIKLLCQKLNKLRLLMGRQHAKQSMNTLKAYIKNLTAKENEFILRRAKKLMAKYFALLHKETIIQKLERENEEAKRQLLKEKKQQETAEDFREYRLYMRAMHAWKRYSRLVRIEKKRIEEETMEAINKKTVVEQPVASGLKSKVSDFLNSLKKDIEGQQNRPVPPAPQVIEEDPNEMTESVPTNPSNQQNEQPNHQVENEEEYYEQLINAEPSSNAAASNNAQHASAPHIPGRKLTHEELLKRRDELERKNKERKERLQLIRKEKEEQRLKLEQERKLSQQRMKEEETKRKQEEYQRFQKRKREEQQARENELKEIERLQRLYGYAEAEDKIRLKVARLFIQKFFGWLPWRKLLQQRNSNFEKLAAAVEKGHLKLYWLRFLEQYKLHCSQLDRNEELQSKRALRLYKKHSQKHVISLLREFKRQVEEEKIELLSRRCLNIQRIVFKAWKRALPSILHENYEEEKRITSKVEAFRNGFLLRFCFRSLAHNKEDEKRQRLMALHRNNLKGKISEWIKDDRTLDVDKLLE